MWTEKMVKLIAIRCRLTIHVAVAISMHEIPCQALADIARMILVKNVTDAEHAHAHCTHPISMKIRIAFSSS